MEIKLALKLSEEQVHQLADLVVQKVGGQTQRITGPKSVSELAEILQIHESTLYRQIQSGNVKKIPHLGRVLIPAKEVARLL